MLRNCWQLAALPKASDYNKADVFTGAPATAGIQGVDLRPDFPPVGEQSMNDCTAWARLKTTPYVPLDFRTQPSSFAFEEASRYKMEEAYILENPGLFKRVLQENILIVIGAHLTPKIFDGRFSSYTKKCAWSG